MPITDLPGRPAPVEASFFVRAVFAALEAEATALTAGLFSGYLPTLAACLKTYAEAVPAPAAVVPAVGVDEPLAVLPAPLLVSWTTRNTITTTPITDAARYRTIRVPPSRCGDLGPDRGGPERDLDPRPGEARLPSSYPGAAGASKPCGPYPSWP